MWAVIGVWDIDPDKIDELRAQGHMIQVYDNEGDARRYHSDMLEQGHVEQPGVRSIVWDVAEVGAESQAP